MKTIFYLIIFISTVQKNNGSNPNEDQRKNEVEDIFIRFYNGKSFDDAKITSQRLDGIASTLRQLPIWDASLPTVLYIHGYVEDQTANTIREVLGAYLTRGGHNILLLDWANMAQKDYFFNAVPNVKKVAKATAEILRTTLFAQDIIQLDKFHIVGHSLGSQIAGFIGKNLKKNGITLPRITGLDPAYPCFYGIARFSDQPAESDRHLSSGDAAFVDVIHTDARVYGTPFSTGDADFWVNGGFRHQPGCPFRIPFTMTDVELCSHQRSCTFYAESILREKSFLAVKCSSWSAFKSGACRDSDVVVMGYATDHNIRGDYYLRTNGESPYGMSVDGLK